AYDIAVKRDLNGVRAALKQIMPSSEIQIDGLGDGVVLTGTAVTPIEAQQAGDLAAKLAGGADKVVNSTVGRGRDQAMPKVTGPDPDVDLGRIRNLHRGRRIPDSRRLFVRPDHPRLYHPDQLQEVRYLAQLHACGADGRPHQPARDDGSLRTVQRQLADLVAVG